MREKELRLALICYGGVSLAVYMHGVTKEAWRLARASRDHLEGADGSNAYRRLLERIEAETGVRLRVFADIVAGASAGGINGVFLAQAIATGQSLEPLTDLWLDKADIDALLDPDARPMSAFTKWWAQPLVWWLAGRKGGTVERTVERPTRQEVRRKLSHLVRARWFAPPFGGAGFTAMLLDAFDAMEAAPAGPSLVPPGQPLDLFVTVTDFHGRAEPLRLNSPATVLEREHRMVLSFKGGAGALADPAELAFAARATASLPGAFPPFTIAEIDRVLGERRRDWPGRARFLQRIMPTRFVAGAAAQAALIDGSVLVNAPFGPAIAALRDRPARREVDRRFVYIDPKPGGFAIGRSDGEEERLPGFLALIFGALSDLPRSQPIRDNLEAIEGRSARIRAMRAITDSLRPEVEQSIDELFEGTLFLNSPTPARLKAWRARAQDRAARSAGHAYAAYAHLKLANIAADVAAALPAVSRAAIDREIAEAGFGRVGAGKPASPALLEFLRDHDLRFRIRRLRFLARRLAGLEHDAAPGLLDAARRAIYECLALYVDREQPDFHRAADTAPRAALDTLAATRNLKAVDDLTDDRLAEALSALPKPERRALLLAYLGFPFYDIATLALLQGEGLDEFDPVKVDRISPEDAPGLRSGAEETLKGTQFNTFGAFFSRAFRENDYLWGRLHGAERLIDIVLSSAPEPLGTDTADALKREAFAAILDEEEPRLPLAATLIAELRLANAAARA